MVQLACTNQQKGKDMSKFVTSLCLALAIVCQGCSDDSGEPPTHSDATVDVAADVPVDAVSSETSVEDVVATDASVVDASSGPVCGDAAMDVPGC